MRDLAWSGVIVAALTVAGPVAAASVGDADAARDRGDYATEFRFTLPLAQQGNAKAQFNLGVMYYDGQGVPQYYFQAVKWFRLAAAQGHANAQNILGVSYRDGKGVPKDAVQAVKWYRLATAQGIAEAQYNLAVM